MLRILALLALVASAPAQAQDEPDFSAVTALLQDSLGQFGGGEFLLMQHGRVLYRESFHGWDSTRAVSIASASKWLSGTLVMSLVADGTLSLDDTVGDWLPDVPADKRAITLRQLFALTSGLPPLDVGGCLDDRTTTLEACAQSILDGRMLNVPGEVFRYGGLSMQVAGRMAEVATGQPFNDLFAERVAAPLGLTRTDFGLGDNPRIAGGANSTAVEYARVLQLLLDGGAPVLTPAAVDSMLADQTRGAPIAYSPYRALAQLVGDPALAEIRYGIGVWREVVDPATGGAVEFASQGAHGFSPWIDRPNGVVAVLAVKNELRAVYPTYLQLKSLVRDLLSMPTSLRDAPPEALELSISPNPASGVVRVHYTLNAPKTARLAVYDALGREVALLARGPRSVGEHEVVLDVAALPGGTYVVRLDASGGVQARTVTLVR